MSNRRGPDYNRPVADTTVLDELVRQHEAAPPARDRLMTMLLLVTALHALVILGVTFGAGRANRGAASSLPVLLVHTQHSEEKQNTSADYLAEVNQHGSSVAAEPGDTESPHRTTPPTPPHDMTDTATEPAGHHRPPGERDLLASRATSRQQRYFGATGQNTGSMSPLIAEPLPPEIIDADDGASLRLKGKPQRELLVTPNVRESAVAVYLHAWRRKVERIGTANYPLSALGRKDLSGNPVLEVQILADGRLGTVTVQRSSGHPELDQAALGILRLAAPFDPFPRDLAVAHDALRLSYEWRFLGGDLNDGQMRITDTPD